MCVALPEEGSDFQSPKLVHHHQHQHQQAHALVSQAWMPGQGWSKPSHSSQNISKRDPASDWGIWTPSVLEPTKGLARILQRRL